MSATATPTAETDVLPLVYNGALTPRPDLSPSQLVQLGEGLRRWLAAPGGLAVFVDPAGLAALLAGELPAPVASRNLAVMDGWRERAGLPSLTPEEREAAAEDMLGGCADPEARAGLRRVLASNDIFFAVRCTVAVHYVDAANPDAPPADWLAAVDGLRRAIPAGLIEDVVLNNRSWRDR